MPSLTKRDLLKTSLLGATVGLAQASLVGSAFAAPPTATRRSFRPGDIWTDTEGKPIQAHAGSILQVADTFYWYGENKEFTTGKTDIWTWGVRCYSSKDLYNWQDLGLIIKPITDDKTSPLHPAAGLDRPHIIYHKPTKKFVCWVKILNQGGQTRTVLTADKITGPYTIVATGLRPFGMNAGDFDIAIAPEDGKAYMFFERVHTEMICADLTDDYTNFSGYYSTHFPRPGPPSVREAPAHFQRNNKHFLLTSGTSVYYPNPSEAAVADTFHGPYTILGDLHPDDRSRTSCNSQISSVFKHPKKKDLYIALADRWMGPLSGPAFESGDTSRMLQSAFTKVFSPARPKLTPAEGKLLGEVAGAKVDTSKARYVWLPITFENDRPIIHWRDEWTIEEFA